MKRRHRKAVLKNLAICLESISPSLISWLKENCPDLRCDSFIVRKLSKSSIVFDYQLSLSNTSARVAIRCHPKSLKSSVRSKDFLPLYDGLVMNFEKVKARSYYDDNFEPVFFYEFNSGEDIYVPHQMPNICRFCGANSPSDFQKRAHAIPALIGNHSLLTKTECDKCNHYFGQTLEQEWAAYTLIERNLFRVKNRDFSIPSIRNKHFKVDATEDTTFIYVEEGSEFFQFDQTDSSVRWTIPAKSYIPYSILKMLFKAAISVMPDEMYADYENIGAWVGSRDSRCTIPKICSYAIQSTIPSGCPFGDGYVLLLRNIASTGAPSLTFVLAFKNMCYQIFLQNSLIPVRTFYAAPFIYTHPAYLNSENSKIIDFGGYTRKHRGKVIINLRVNGKVQRGKIDLD